MVVSLRHFYFKMIPRSIEILNEANHEPSLRFGFEPWFSSLNIFNWHQLKNPDSFLNQGF